jgi:hypothetical protein
VDSSGNKSRIAPEGGSGKAMAVEHHKSKALRENASKSNDNVFMGYVGLFVPEPKVNMGTWSAELKSFR